MLFDKGSDGTKHLSEYVENEARMKEEGRINVVHDKDFKYFLYDGETMKKEVVEKSKYIIMFDRKDRQAKYQKVTNDVSLHKQKPLAPNRKGIASEEFSVVKRKPFASEASKKNKLLNRMGV